MKRISYKILQTKITLTVEKGTERNHYNIKSYVKRRGEVFSATEKKNIYIYILIYLNIYIYILAHKILAQRPLNIGFYNAHFVSFIFDILNM